MGWRTTADVGEFLDEAGEFLRRERMRNTVLLTVAETVRQAPGRYGGAGDPGNADPGNADPGGKPLFGWWTPSGDGVGGRPIGGAFLHTPPHSVLLSVMPAEAAAELPARTIAGRNLAGVNGNEDAAQAFAAAWRNRTGGLTAVRTRTRLYRLGTLTPPNPSPTGVPRRAVRADTGRAVGWFTAFMREAEGEGAVSDQGPAVAERLSYGGLTFWEDEGAPVSMASLSRQVAGIVRVNGVYTPPESRGRGYASAVTAAVSEEARSNGAEEVLLYTDLANPVSNSIYQRIGYRPVEDRVMLAFKGG